MTALALLLRDPHLRAVAAMVALLGIVNSCIYPYLSLIAVHELGISDAGLALVLAMGSAVAVSTSVLFGILADRFGTRRMIALWTALALVVSTGLMTLLPGLAVFVLAQGLFFPIGSSIFGQIFALNNLASQRFPAEREGIQAAARAVLSASFLVMLMIWTWLLAGDGIGVLWVYPVAMVAGLAMVALIWRAWPRRGAEPWVEQSSGLSIGSALLQLAQPGVSLRLLAMGAMGALPMLYMILTPLLFAASPARQTSDVALMVGLVAGFEVPFMLMIARLSARWSRTSLIASGAGLYAVFVLLLAYLSNSPWLIWGLPALAGLAAAPLLTLPIGYWQDLFRGRPGTAAALMALQKLVGDLISALVFATGTAIGGYWTAAVIGGGVALLGGAALVSMDRRAAQAAGV